MIRLILLLLLVSAGGFVQAQETVPTNSADDSSDSGEKPKSANVAVFKAVDKINARSTDLKIPVKQSVSFGTLKIYLESCQERITDMGPDNVAYVRVTDSKEADEAVFKGWMFSSSPSLNPLEHPSYDLWLVDCTQ